MNFTNRNGVTDTMTVIASILLAPLAGDDQILLRLDHDMSYEEIAAALNISLAAAKVRVHRARLKLASARSTGEWNNEG